VCHGHCCGRHPFGCGENESQRIFLPGRAGFRAAAAAPQIDNWLAAEINGAGGPPLTPLAKISLELVANALEFGRYRSFDAD